MHHFVGVVRLLSRLGKGKGVATVNTVLLEVVFKTILHFLFYRELQLLSLPSDDGHASFIC